IGATGFGRRRNSVLKSTCDCSTAAGKIRKEDDDVWNRPIHRIYSHCHRGMENGSFPQTLPAAAGVCSAVRDGCRACFTAILGPSAAQFQPTDDLVDGSCGTSLV